MIVGLRLTEDYSVDLTVLERVRAWRDGVDFVDLKSAVHLYREDHNPRWEFRLDCLNVCLLGIDVYNVHHAEPDVPITRSWCEEAMG